MAGFATNDDNQKLVSFLEIEKMLIDAVGEISGVDMSGREYKGIEDLWCIELSNNEPVPWIQDFQDSDDDSGSKVAESQTLCISFVTFEVLFQIKLCRQNLFQRNQNNIF